MQFLIELGCDRFTISFFYFPPFPPPSFSCIDLHGVFSFPPLSKVTTILRRARLHIPELIFLPFPPLLFPPFFPLSFKRPEDRVFTRLASQSVFTTTFFLCFFCVFTFGHSAGKILDFFAKNFLLPFSPLFPPPFPDD